MRVTGIVRRIDELGRLVIPKEIRKVLKIRCGDSIEIFVNEKNNIELNKFSPLDNSKHLIDKLVNSISLNLEVDIIIFDFEKIISSNKKAYLNYEIKPNIYELLEKNKEQVLFNDQLELTKELVIHNGYLKHLDIYGNKLGGLVIFSEAKDKEYKKIAAIIENFLRELESD